MEFDFSTKGLFQPGESTCFFDLHADQKFEVNAINYSPINAWWLAECSRLIYRVEDDETGNPAHARRRKVFFEAVHFQETAFWQTPIGTQCALLETTESVADQFAVLVFRGTQGLKDWNTNSRFLKTNWAGSGRVHRGFYRALQPICDEILVKLNAINSPLFYTGHSLGAALATMMAALHPPRALYTYGSPRVGDSTFAASLDNVPTYRIVNNRDIVPTIPQPFLGYHHIGEQHCFGRDGTDFINPNATDLQSLRQSKYGDSDPKRRWNNPPEFMTDHAPVNYVVHLERVVLAVEK